MKHPHRILTPALAGLGLLLLAGGVAHAAKGPRASVSVATVCSLDGTDLTVELRIRDRSSGDVTPLLTAWSVDASYLERGVPGNQWQPLTSDGQSGLQQAIPVTIASTFSLCAAGGGIRPELADARALNGLAEVTYGRDDGAGGVTGLRTIRNRCSDDPETPDVIEPSGISLTPADVAQIDLLCQP